MTRTAALTTALVFAFALTTLADEPLAKTNSAEDAPGQAAVTAEAMKRAVAHFEEKVQPLLAARCFKCHGPDKQKGGLRLDSRAAVLHGGQSGPAVAPHRVQESLLIEAVRYESLEMPPDRPLAKDEVDAVVQWVEQGAVWPAAEGAPPLRLPGQITADDREFWSFQPIRRPDPPAAHASLGPVDAFLQEKRDAHNAETAPEIDRLSLIRRAYFDVVGLPPTPEEVSAFLADPSEAAYQQLVDRLLERDEFGQKWARHWLDLVRYAESDGFKADDYRPNAWRYRDYVIRAFNQDMPFDQFIVEQLAGDEIAPDDPQVTVATAYLRHGIYEYNQRDVRTQWDNMINELVDVTSDAFLGLGVSCARCHDHKFDPVLRKDYFRLRAFFEPVLPRDDLPFADAAKVAEYQEARRAWESTTAELRAALAELEEPARRRAIDGAIDKFPQDVRPLLRKSPEERTPAEAQIAALAERQLKLERTKIDYKKTLQGDQLTKWIELTAQLEELAGKPPVLAESFAVTDVGPQAPPTMIPGDRQQRVIAPGFPTVLEASPAEIVSPPNRRSTGRRLTLARWIASPENPLTARVIVNRIWRRYLGRGLVSTPSDFGRLGERPTHPELLDWLASELIENGWSLKHIHRTILLSQAYRLSSRQSQTESSRTTDPDNRWFTRAPTRRLEAEQIRDAMLSVSGELQPQEGGPPADHDALKRTVFLKVMRNNPLEMSQQFDGPDGFGSVALRNSTTTPSQALLMLNSPWTMQRAQALADRLLRETNPTQTNKLVERAYWLALTRPPSSDELDLARELIGEAPFAQAAKPTAALVDFCHVLLNCNEFIYLD